MDAEWITSPAARRILVHFADPRPAWLWAHDGDTLLWRNPAAKLFNGRIKKHGLKLSPGAVPIKGQVARLIRLGGLDRASLSRVQMLAGDKPLSVTCSCTPLLLIDGELALLLVALDPVPADIREAAGGLLPDAMSEALFPVGVSYRLAGPEAADETGGVRLAAGPDGATLVFGAAEPPPDIADVRAEEGIAAEDPPPPAEEPAPPTEAPEEPGALSALFDRLADDAELYTPLSAADETFAGAAPAPAPDFIAGVIAAEVADGATLPAPDEAPHTHWQITGRGFRALPPAPEPETKPEPEAEPPPAEPAAPITLDAEAADRVTRYNFEELGRLLSDRVATEPPAEPEPEAPPAPSPPASPSGIINLNAETLVLNRLPLAILVFRDQQVLFANRALTDLLGYDSVGRLREAGIAAIFPAEDAAQAGPVNRLLRRDGTALRVTARLQSVSWQGRAALMLSASGAEPAAGHEGAIRAFAELAAAAREEGFIAADRAGVVTEVSGTGRLLLGKEEPDLVGKPLATLVGAADLAPLRAFLEQPARFAETARPSLVFGTDDGAAEFALFAEGQAGIVSGYFGFIRGRAPALAVTAKDAADPGLLGRLSRGIRRPLNTIIGFADLIRSAASGDGPADRTAEYASDIRTAGLEIAVLADELDDFTRLKEGHYAPRPADVDLGALLESCMVRVRAQAGAARVLVRSAISERLPRIRADRASLGQALLNLLASAIDQTPIGGSVILSAQAEEDGGIAIHVRDGAQNGTDLGERFVVFRDGVSKDGEQLAPVRSSVGLALTRSLLAVNACSLSVDPTVGTGTLFSLLIPAELVARP